MDDRKFQSLISFCHTLSFRYSIYLYYYQWNLFTMKTIHRTDWAAFLREVWCFSFGIVDTTLRA